jgi:Flp pilus assembly protein TadD
LAWSTKGAVLVEQGKYNEALPALDKAIQLNPNYIDAWHNKGVALKLLGRDAEARFAFACAGRLGMLGIS